MRVYVDGCSLTYGQGLPREYSLAQLFKSQGLYPDVRDKSRPGKSNIGIFYDTLENKNNFDMYILGFTFDNRTHLKFRDQDIDFHLSRNFAFDYQGEWDSILEDEFVELNRAYYNLYDSNYYRKLNDFLVDSLVTKLRSLNKIVIPFSWQPRSTDFDIFYPLYGKEYWISESDHHLNKQGMMHLYHAIHHLTLNRTMHA